MSAKNEIERRIKKNNYIKIAKDLFNKDFDSLSGNEYKDILKIADLNGSKYKKIYKLKNDVDIRTLTSNLTPQSYTPDYTTHFDQKIISIVKTDTSFKIYTEFYTAEEIFVDITIDGQDYKKKENTNYRRVMILEKNSTNNYLIISIDPIGEGASVYKKLEDNLNELTSTLGINIKDFFNEIEIEKSIFKLISDNKLIPNKLIVKDETTNRVKSVTSQAARDNIKDDDMYDSCENSDLKLQNIKMKFQKDSLEVFGTTLLKITTKADEKITDELTTEIISAL
jgi:hypothetical protein